MRCIIAGTRTASKEETYKGIISSGFADEITTVISGAAEGADTFGEKWAEENFKDLKRFRANWKMFGKSAGVKRNIEMAKNADALIAIWDGNSKGTFHMINEAKRKGLRVYIHNYND